jgi:hypothetical protein
VGTPQRNRVLARRRLHRDQRARLPAMRRHRHDAARSGRRQPSDTIRPVAPHEPGCLARQSASGQTGVAQHREHLRRRHVGSIPALGLGYQPKARGCGRACLRVVVLSSRKPHYPRQELITLVSLLIRGRGKRGLLLFLVGMMVSEPSGFDAGFIVEASPAGPPGCERSGRPRILRVGRSQADCAVGDGCTNRPRCCAVTTAPNRHVRQCPTGPVNALASTSFHPASSYATYTSSQALLLRIDIESRQMQQCTTRGDSRENRGSLYDI